MYIIIYVVDGTDSCYIYEEEDHLNTCMKFAVNSIGKIDFMLFLSLLICTFSYSVEIYIMMFVKFDFSKES